jgi:hypothetical protein
LKNYFLILLFFIVLDFPKAVAQSNQLWLDYMAYPIRDLNWDYELNVGYNRLLSEGGWTDVYFNNTVTFQKLWWMLFDGSLELHYTYDPQYLNSFEIRPWIMTTLRWNTEGEYLNLFRPFIAALFEFREIIYEGDTPSEQKMRIRTRLGGRITINNKTMSVKTFYVPFRVEMFFDLNGSATERFASKSRLMLGLGYIFSSAFRAEFVYYVNSSRNTYEDKFNATDNIFSLVVRHDL